MSAAPREHVAAVIIERLPDVLASLLAAYDPEVLTSAPEPGEWSVHQVIEHLVTGDGPAFRTRVETISGGVGRIESFDPAAVMGARDPDRVELSVLLGDLRAERVVSAALVRSLTEEQLAMTATHPQGEFAADDFVLEWPFHDHDHLQQIHEILKMHHAAGMSATMRRALEIDGS